MAYEPTARNVFNFFETGIVTDCNQKNGTCSVQRAEGGVLENVPVLNITGGGGQSTDATWVRNLRGAHVVMIPIQGILFILGTIPSFDTTSTQII